MRLKIYNALVNEQPGICERYHKVHDDSRGIKNIISWVYLLWLNFAFYVLFCKWLGKKKDIAVYESKKLNVYTPESQLDEKLSPEEFAKQLMDYDVISFDIFDTLILRPFSEPTDLFYIVGQEINYMDFKRIRMEAEKKARISKYEKEKTYEVTLEEIWEQMEALTGIDKNAGMALEIETELKLCYANSYMRIVFDKLIQANKFVVITSDMYLPVDILKQLLNKCGYYGYTNIYVSNRYRISKANGHLYQFVKNDLYKSYGSGIKLAHVGDNEISDVKLAEENGFVPFHYSNVNELSKEYRCYDLSPVIGGAYRGIVNNRLYNGMEKFNFNQEYGYIYGGLFVLGYCNYIHDYCKTHGIDKILFLSRDGEILKQVYEKLYPAEKTEYVYISRIAAAKWAAPYMKYDFLRKLVLHKVGLGKSYGDILMEMELEELIPFFDTPETKLTPNTVDAFIDFLNNHWRRVIEIYRPQVEAAGKWYRNIVGFSENVLAVDIGWAGSGFMALKLLFENAWNINCKLTGMVAGTNTAHSAEPDMSETMLLDGSLVSYLYSSRDNRELWKKHNPSKNYNLYFELITSSPSQSFKGFYFKENGEIECRFSSPEKNPEGVKDIWKGILDFVDDYHGHFKDYPYMLNISGRDAYAPMLLAASNDEEYLKKIYREFNLQVSVE